MRSERMGKLLAAVIWLGVATPLLAQNTPAQGVQVAPQEGDYVFRDFHFNSGELLPELRLHYTTLGAPARDASGRVTNAVMVLHGTGGSGRQFLSPQFAGELFGPGQLLDASRYFIILPDSIGHGRSSKPSEGLRTRFPRSLGITNQHLDARPKPSGECCSFCNGRLILNQGIHDD